MTDPVSQTTVTLEEFLRKNEAMFRRACAELRPFGVGTPEEAREIVANAESRLSDLEKHLLEELERRAGMIERQEAELTFWRDGLSASEVADNMKLWELQHG